MREFSTRYFPTIMLLLLQSSVAVWATAREEIASTCSTSHNDLSFSEVSDEADDQCVGSDARRMAFFGNSLSQSRLSSRIVLQPH